MARWLLLVVYEKFECLCENFVCKHIDIKSLNKIKFQSFRRQNLGFWCEKFEWNFGVGLHPILVIDWIYYHII